MKRKLLFRITACTIAAVIVAITLNVNINSKSSDLSDMVLANVEALARSEGGDCSCYGPKEESYSNTTFCRCINDKCCKDNHGCD